VFAGIPFPDNIFDFIICTAALKNFKEPFKALSEMYRVLTSGGTALIIDLNRNTSNQQIESNIENMERRGRDKLFINFIFKYFLEMVHILKTNLSTYFLKRHLKNTI
jgi:ubiquinone/menaquinone biosynthesis C-methylase UbiE